MYVILNEVKNLTSGIVKILRTRRVLRKRGSG